MKNTMLLPRACRIAGLLLLPVFATLFIANTHFDFSIALLNTPKGPDDGMLNLRNNNLTDEVAICGTLICLFMIAFARLKNEDEYVSFLRLKSLQWGVFANYAIFILLTLSVYGGNYMAVLFYNVATILVLFILIFNYHIHIKPRITKTEMA